MINLSEYSCDKCARLGSRHCKHCWHTADKAPTKFKRKNNMFRKLIKEAQDIDDAINSFKTPEFRKPTPPPPPTSGSNAVKPKNPCIYETPCGWCTKWDKKCDKKIPKSNLCARCHYNNWFLSQCNECDESNDFKNFRRMETTK